jgi:lipopolysaccharide assembly outer membrane protein LptD (OstA)
LLTYLSTRAGPSALLSILFLVLLPTHLRAQDTLTGKRPDTLAPAVADTTRKDTAAIIPLKPKLESRVEYVSRDSIRFEVKDKKVILFKEADLKYQDIELKADYIEIDFPSNTVYATGMPDSTGKEAGTPEFTQGDQKFRSKVINYNYTSKKGYIQKVMTQQDEGYLQGQVVKKEADDVTYIKKGWYTTCNNEENPHFEFRFDKAKVIPGKSIITGPAYMAIADVPTPLMIPFGYFPNKKGQRSGIILPTYGESESRGFFLENGGYYWAINKYMDLKFVGDIFSRGSWALKPVLSYKVRYKFSGNLNLSYALNRLGIEGTPGFSRQNDYRIAWTHTQDRKARPKSSFSANVNIQSGEYNKYDVSSTPDQYLTNTFQSSINYATNFGGKVFLNLNFNHNQNTIENTMTINFPQISMSVNQIYPFRNPKRVGKAKWYDKIGIRYNLDAQNRYNTYDSTLFAPGWLEDLQNGIKHTLPVGGTWNILKYINFSNALNINDRMYFSTIRKQYVDELIVNGDTTKGYYKTDTVYAFSNAFDFSLSTGINTRLYGMYQFKKGPLMAIRHMITPSVSFSYTPDFGAPFWGYYRPITNDTATVNPKEYSIFQGTIYGGPPAQESGLVSFSIANNLEMKVRNRKDTVNGFKKIALIDNFTISTSYDIARDSLNWAPIALQGRTTLFKGLSIQYASLWDIYARDTNGNRYNQTEWKVNHRLLRLDNTSWDIGLNYSIGSEKFKKKAQEIETMAARPDLTQEEMDVLDYYDNYVDFDIPWSINFNYSFRYTKNYDISKQERVDKIVQTLGFNGQLNITPKWKITLYTGWDFTNNELAYTRIDIYRDLHCWEMRFGWVPKGAQQMWTFAINVKASVLQDMKLNKKKNFYDY